MDTNTTVGENEESVVEDRDRDSCADSDEYTESDAEDEAAAPLEWTDRSRWIRHVVLWKQEHDAQNRRQRGKTDKGGARMKPNGYDSAAAAESENSQVSNSRDDAHEESADSADHNDEMPSARDRVDAPGAQQQDARAAVDRQQQQPLVTSAVVAISSEDSNIPRSSDSLSIAASSETTTAAGNEQRSHKLGRNLPSMILKHISALKRESAEVGDSLSVSIVQDAQQGRQATTSAVSGGTSSEQSAASASELSVASLAPPTRHVRRSSKMDGLEVEKEKEKDKSGRHSAKRSVTTMRSASGKWPGFDLSMTGSAGTPSFAQIASMGRSLLQSAHDDPSGDGGFDIDTHSQTQTRATHSARGGNTTSRTGSASTALSTNGHTVEPTRSSLSPGQLKADLLASGVVRDHTHVFTVYPASVTASELIDWLIANKHADDREHACLVSKTLLLVGLRSFHQQHMDSSDFADDGRFYTFESAASTKGALRMALDRPRDRSVSTKQALAALMQRAAASATTKRPAAGSLAGQVERARVQSAVQSRLKLTSSQGETGTQLTTLQEVRVDGQEAAEAATQQPRASPSEGRGKNASSHHMVADTSAADPHSLSAAVSQSHGNSPPSATRPVFLRVRKASSRWQITQTGHPDVPAADSDPTQHQRYDSGPAAADAASGGAGGVHFHTAQVHASNGSAHSGRSPSAHQRASTTAFTVHQVRSHRLTATAGSGVSAAVKPKEVDGLSLTQEALFALGVADLALVETQLAEQRQRDQNHGKAAGRAAQPLLPGEVGTSGDSHGSFERQTNSPLGLGGRGGHVRSPTQPPSGVINMARSDSPSQSMTRVLIASTPAAQDKQAASRASSLRNIMHMAKAAK